MGDTESERAADPTSPVLFVGGPAWPTPPSVTAVVPIKGLARAKSRLTLAGRHRETLALAFARDTLAALAASPLVRGVVVVTSDPMVVDRLSHHPVRLLPDDEDGLGPAVRSGIRAAATWAPESGVAVVPADLPCLRPTDVASLLATASSTDGAFVPDLSGAGTTVVLHPPRSAMASGYGPGSAARHEALGLRRLDDAPARARQDVDTVEDLRAALLLGVGPATLAAVATVETLRSPLLDDVALPPAGPTPRPAHPRHREDDVS